MMNMFKDGTFDMQHLVTWLQAIVKPTHGD
jgi:hypothetical protein